MRRAILSIAVILVIWIAAAAALDYKLNILDKSEAIRVVLEDRVRDDQFEGSLLVVSSPQIIGLTLPQSIDGVPLVLVTLDELGSWDASVSIYAIQFDYASMRGWGEGCRINISTSLNSHFRGWNEFVTYELTHVGGAWVIDSKVVSAPV